MKRLKSIENDQVQLEVIECDCGYHIGIDATYLDQVGDFKTKCPSCKAVIDTALVCPENDFTLQEVEGEGACDICGQHIYPGEKVYIRELEGNERDVACSEECRDKIK